MPYQYMMDVPGFVQPGYGYGVQQSVQVQYAGFGIRALAYLIDSVMVSIIGFVINFVIAFIAVIGNPNAVNDSQSTAVSVMSYIVSFLISFSYYAGMWMMNGATFGQRWLGLRVVDEYDFGAVGPGKAVIRYLGMVVSFLICFLGVIWVAFDSRKQGLHDKLAGTVVIRV